MYQIQLYSYVPRPQPVTGELIVAAHYYGAWKKGAAQVHRGFPEIYEYPERTPLIGYYDEENPELADWEYKWALEHGINCFIHCWYRLKENLNHPVTINDLRCGHALHEAMFHSRYGNMMKFAIMFETQPRWAATNERDLLENLMPFWMENYFSRENYLKIDNKPVLFVYDLKHQLRDSFESAQAQAYAFDRCRELAQKKGFDGMIFAIEYGRGDMEPIEEYKGRGYDFSFSYAWVWDMPLRPSQEEVMEHQLHQLRVRKEYDPEYFIATASCSWDPWPRLKSMPHIYGTADTQSRWRLQPDTWRKLLGAVREWAQSLPQQSYGRRLMMIDNWNEWDEGHYVAPSYEFGFKYLEAIREELTKCDNLPDYRLPLQLGTNPVNNSWEEPDLSKYCTGKLDEENGTECERQNRYT